MNARRAISLGLLALTLLGGVAICGYLTWHHENQVYGAQTVELANCKTEGIVNCDAVNTSRFSEMLGVPIAAFGVPTYLLLLWLVVRGRREDRALAYAFTIGLLTVAYSGWLFFVSTYYVGFLCAWCMRLYGINAAIPILGAVAAGRSPKALLGDTLGDLKVWPGDMKAAAGIFAGLLVVTVGMQQSYRAGLKGSAATAEAPEPSAAASPQVAQKPKASPNAAPKKVAKASAAPAPSTAPSASAFQLPAKVTRLDGEDGTFDPANFDLQARLGAGKAVALIFWAPGFATSEDALVRMSRDLRESFPDLELYAVSGRRKKQRAETLFETWAALPLPEGVPLLMDDKFALSTAMKTTDVPNLTLFDKRGALVHAKLKALDQVVFVPPARRTARQLVEQAVSEPSVPKAGRTMPHYPASELYGRCAPSFTLNDFSTGKPVTFGGKSKKGRPTMLMFWSSTCSHCQKEIPQLVRWLKENPNRVDVVSVSRIRKDKPGKPSHRKVTAAYLRAEDIEFPVLEDPDGAVAELYRNVSTPTTYFVAPDGAITKAWFYAHTKGFDEALDKALTGASVAQGCKPAAPLERPVLSFDMVSPSGEKAPLADRLKGPSLVHFWATWCKPCIAELPALIAFRDRLEKSGGGEVVIVSVEDEDAGEKIAAFEEKRGMKLGSYRAPTGGMAERLDLSYRVPRTYVVDADGAILDLRDGDQKWNDAHLEKRVRSRLEVLGASKAP